MLTGLSLVSVVGIDDPPRPQARDAIALCRRAGVAVKMITGDHADTAAVIARELSIDGEVVTGADLDRMTTDQLAARVDHIGVFRGSPRTTRWRSSKRYPHEVISSP
jgi:Ca2+-transporting ATPase